VTRSIAQNETTVFGGLALGDHRVSISEVASNCAVHGNQSVTVNLTAGATGAVGFAVHCEARVGLLEVTVVAAGTDLDPNGYAVTVDGSERLPVGTGGVYRVTAEAGDRAVALAGVTANCLVGDENPRTLRVPPGNVVPTLFNVECSEAPPGGPGNEIAFVGTEPSLLGPQLYVMNADGTRRRAIADLAFLFDASGLVWDPAGARLAFTALDESGVPTLFVALADGEVEARFTVGGAVAGGKVSWSPDGARLAFSALATACFRLHIMVVNDDGSNPQPLTPACDSSDSHSPAWSPDGTRLAFIQMLDADSIQVNRLVLVAPDGSDPRSFPLTPPNPDGLAWSPDGTRLGFHADIDIPVLVESYGSEIYTIGADGTDLTRLTGSVDFEAFPSWSPDGSQIVFASRRQDGSYSEIYVMDADGGHPQRLSTDSVEDHSPSWRP
jgi:Tol biopolymer transport system component